MVRKAQFWPKYLNFDHFPDIIRDKLAKRQQFGLKLIILSRKSLEMSFLDKLHAKFWSIFDQTPPPFSSKVARKVIFRNGFTHGELWLIFDQTHPFLDQR